MKNNRIIQRGRLALNLIALTILLAACGGSAPRTSDTSASSSTTRSTQKKPPSTQKRGGGYYKDDGPGDDIPDNLDSIPDAQPRLEPLNRFTNRPYVVLGKNYSPRTQLAPYKQRGIASWYGKKFHGQKTSVGETYDMFAMTAAHPTLALPCYVRVTNLSNGKSVVVRVIDRGPFHADRIIDLSYAAAYRLDYIDSGSTRVEVEMILPENMNQPIYAQATPPRIANEASSTESAYASASANAPVAGIATIPERLTKSQTGQKKVFLQLGAFSSAGNAENLRAHLSTELDWLTEEIEINTDGRLFRVHLGPYTNRAEAEKIAAKIGAALGYKPGIVQR